MSIRVIPIGLFVCFLFPFTFANILDGKNPDNIQCFRMQKSQAAHLAALLDTDEKLILG